MSDARTALAQRLGIVFRYRDATGTEHEIDPATRDALLAAMDVGPGEEAARARLALMDEAGALPLWQVVTAGAPVVLDPLDGQDWQLRLEDGTTREGEGAALGEVPLGIHELVVHGAGHWILAAPERLPDPPRAWGVTLPLYGLAPDGRIGSYRDLAEAAASLGAAGADFVGVNPVHAGFPTDPGAASPYSPAHRGRLAAMHVAPASEDPLPAEALLDYEAALPARMAALRAEFERCEPVGFADWREKEPDLVRFALHQALSERYGAFWPDWPEAFRDPDGAAARDFAAENAAALDFHAWLQWQADRQLAVAQEAALEAGMRFGLYLDLAVGTHPAGAETWGQPDLFARGVSLGAPPDAFSDTGQSWGLAPLRPDTLARRGFRPLAAILRRALAHAKLLRIDHILGFERAFWVPDGPDAPPGAYVSMPRAALLAVVRIEAARAGATIVGEDLGNIPEGLRDALQESGILGCRVAQFERLWEADEITFRPAAEYASAALTSFGTHDLPLWEGWKAGRDIDWRFELGTMTKTQRDAALAERQETVQVFCEMIGGASIDALHGFLAQTPSRLVACQIEDLLGRTEQPNLPGTVHDHPNWRRRLGVAAEELGQLDAVRRTVKLMTDADR